MHEEKQHMEQVKRIEQGFPAHFIGADNCLFHLNTYLTSGYVVSTIGLYIPNSYIEVQPIGHHRYFETCVFKACKEADDLGTYCVDHFVELKLIGANDAIEARKNHEAMVLEYQAK